MSTNGRKPDRPRVIEGNALYSLREAEARLGWGRKTSARAFRQGLRAIRFGREAYLTGQEILRFFGELEAQQGGLQNIMEGRPE